jgi:hypothetical protein
MQQVRLYARSRPATSDDREAALFGTRPCGVAAPKHTVPAANVFNTALYQQAACCGVSAYAANAGGRQMRVTRVTLGSSALSDSTAAGTLGEKYKNTSAAVSCESVQSCLDLEEYLAAQNSVTQERTQQQAALVMQWSRDGNRPSTAVLQLPECKLSEELQSHASTVSNQPSDAHQKMQQHQQQQQQQQWVPAVQRRRAEARSSVKPYTPLVCLAPQLPDDVSASGTAPPELSADAAAASLATLNSVLISSQRSTATATVGATDTAANKGSSLDASNVAATATAAGSPAQHSSSNRSTAAEYAQFVCAARDVLLAVVRREDLLCCCSAADFSSAKAAAVPVLVHLSMRAAAAHRAVARCGLYCDAELQAAAVKGALQLEYYSAAAARYDCSTTTAHLCVTL